jgi:hypothetical protein
MYYFIECWLSIKVFLFAIIFHFLIISELFQLLSNEYAVIKHRRDQQKPLLSTKEGTKKKIKVFLLLARNEYISF